MNDADPPEFQTEISLADAEATAGLAITLAPQLRAGDVVLVEGPIGAGKSHFCRSLIQHRLAALGRAEDVPSPTYTLVQVYELDGLEIWHADLYRLTSPEDVFELGLEDAFDQAVCLVEWPDRLGMRNARGRADPATCAGRGSGQPHRDPVGTFSALGTGDRRFDNLRIRPGMIQRNEQETQFLADAGWADATLKPLAGDASARRYQRLTMGSQRAVLMDAPPEHGESTERFARMARWLRQNGYSAPDILAEDNRAGFLLLEDLGDKLFARLIRTDPAMEATLYTAAVDFLVDLHRHPAPDFVAPLDSPALAELVALTPKWYLPGIGAEMNDDAEALPRIIADLSSRIATWRHGDQPAGLSRRKPDLAAGADGCGAGRAPGFSGRGGGASGL